MTRRSTAGNRTTLLELWRPPQGAGDPVGCLATTYTFQPELFEEHCLARFLGIESDPDREDVAFLLEREHRLGSTYAGVVVDYTQAGVGHSLRWDVLAARVRGGKQHAKVSLLAWANCVRSIISSANLTEPGYRVNFEVASAVEFRPEECDPELLGQVLDFLETLLGFVPIGNERTDTRRARDFLAAVRKMCEAWKPPARTRSARHRLACTVPGRGQSARSALGELIAACRSRGPSPHEAWVASPFFDVDSRKNLAAEALCGQMARGRQRMVNLCVPGSRPGVKSAPARLSAPRSLLDTTLNHDARVAMYLVPSADGTDERPWHAKMLGCRGESYSALMAGSSNFTSAGLGLIPACNTEANLITLIDYQPHGREEGLLQRVWSDMEHLPNAADAEWCGPQAEKDDEGAGAPLPAGFLAAEYRGGTRRQLVIWLDPQHLPPAWEIFAEGQSPTGHAGSGLAVLNSSDWTEGDRPACVLLKWHAEEPPEMIRVKWGPNQSFLPLNVDDAGALLPPPALRDMTADEMLAIIAADDPGAAMRAWERNRLASRIGTFDPDLDSASAGELDPLSRYSLAETFLHRVRRRARVMAQLRYFVERPAGSTQAIEWRLRGLIGIDPLAMRMASEFEAAGIAPANRTDPREALLTLADLLIVLRGARYVAQDGSISSKRFDRIYRPFLADLATRLTGRVSPRREALPADILAFWDRTVKECTA